MLKLTLTKAKLVQYLWPHCWVSVGKGPVSGYSFDKHRNCILIFWNRVQVKNILSASAH